MSISIKYVGPHDEVEVPALFRNVAQGETVELEDDHTELAQSLCLQTDNWQPVGGWEVPPATPVEPDPEPEPEHDEEEV